MGKTGMSLHDILAANSRRDGIGSKFHKEERRHDKPLSRNYKHKRMGVEGKWQHDLFASTQKGSAQVAKNKKKFATVSLSPSDVGNLKNVRINVSNLGENVVSEDIQDMFDSFGPSRVQVNFDESGLCAGTADVFFDVEKSAVEAVTHYEGVALDGRQLKMVVMGDERGPTALGSRLSGLSERVTRPRSDIKGRVSQSEKLRKFQRKRTFKLSYRKRNMSGYEPNNRFLDRLADDEADGAEKRSSRGRKSAKAKKSAKELDRELDEYMCSKKK